jgi:hypothetical protein
MKDNVIIFKCYPNPNTPGFSRDFILPQLDYNNLNMKPDKGPRFTLNGQTITDNRTGMSAELYQEGNSWEVTNIQNTGTLSAARIQATANRMKAWYVFTQINK